MFDIAADASIASRLGNSHEHLPSYIVRLLQPVSTCQPVSNCPLSVCHMQSMPKFQHRFGSAHHMCCAVWGSLRKLSAKSQRRDQTTRGVKKRRSVSAPCSNSVSSCPRLVSIGFHYNWITTALLVRTVSRHVQYSFVSVSTIIGSRFDCTGMSSCGRMIIIVVGELTGEFIVL